MQFMKQCIVHSPACSCELLTPSGWCSAALYLRTDVRAERLSVAIRSVPQCAVDSCRRPAHRTCQPRQNADPCKQRFCLSPRRAPMSPRRARCRSCCRWIPAELLHGALGTLAAERQHCEARLPPLGQGFGYKGAELCRLLGPLVDYASLKIDRGGQPNPRQTERTLRGSGFARALSCTLCSMRIVMTKSANSRCLVPPGSCTSSLLGGP